MSNLSLGCLQIFIHSSSIFKNQLGLTQGSIRCDLTVSSNTNINNEKPLIVQRNTKSEEYNFVIAQSNNVSNINNKHSFEWEEQVEIRCNIGWGLFIGLIIDDIENGEIILEVDHIVIGTNNDNFPNGLNDYILKKGNEIYGEIKLFWEYIPNHQSYRCLSEDCLSNEVLPSLLLDELYAMLQLHHNSTILQTTLQDSMLDNTLTDESSLHISNTDISLNNSINNNNNNNNNNESNQSIIEEYNANEVTRIGDSDEESTTFKGQFSTESKKLLLNGIDFLKNYSDIKIMNDKLFELYQISLASSLSVHVIDPDSSYNLNSTIPSSLPVYKAVYITKTFLLPLTNILTQAPPLTITLLEKQLSIFLNTIKFKINNINDSIELNQSYKNIMEYDILHNSDLNETIDDNITWKTLCLFTTITGLWLLQHSLIASSLMGEFDIGIDELEAIRNIFFQYDVDLSGNILDSDVQYLLQDMNENYSEFELSLIMDTIDPDNLDSIEFTEFIAWWCATDLSADEYSRHSTDDVSKSCISFDNGDNDVDNEYNNIVYHEDNVYIDNRI